METFKNLFTLRPASRPKETAAAPSGGSCSLQSQFEAQTARLREIYRVQRPKKTTRAHEPKQKEWEDWCAGLGGNTDGAWVTEDKLCPFLEQKVINRESRASGYQTRKAKRKEMWKDGERAKKRRKTAEPGGRMGKEGGKGRRKRKKRRRKTERNGTKKPWTPCLTKRSDSRSSTATYPPSSSFMRGSRRGRSRRRCGERSSRPCWTASAAMRTGFGASILSIGACLPSWAVTMLRGSKRRSPGAGRWVPRCPVQWNPTCGLQPNIC
jgi:hypothetical protein